MRPEPVTTLKVRGIRFVPIGMALLGVRPDLPNGGTGYLLPFEIASVHLLVVLIGAAYLARAKRRIDDGLRISQRLAAK